jgi:hypothetical protein
VAVGGTVGSGTPYALTVDVVTNVNNIQFVGATVTDETGGQVAVVITPPNIGLVNFFPTGNIDTTSASYADVTASDTELSFTKVFDDTDLIIDISTNVYGTNTNNAVSMALLVEDYREPLPHEWIG